MADYQKFGTDYQGLAHAYAYAGKNYKGECYGDRMFCNSDTMYSYGHHYIIAKKVRNKKTDLVDFVLFNSHSSTATTNKQKYCVRRAINDKLIEAHSDISNFKPIAEINAKREVIMTTIKSYVRARAEYIKNDYLATILVEIKDIKFIAEYYRIKSKLNKGNKEILKLNTDLGIEHIIKELTDIEISVRRSEKISRTRKINTAAKQVRESILREKEDLIKWKKGELSRIYLRHERKDAMRIVDGEINTTQNVNITITEFTKGLRLLRAKKLIGYKVDNQYVVKSVTDERVVIGCHIFDIEEIQRIENIILPK